MRKKRAVVKGIIICMNDSLDLAITSKPMKHTVSVVLLEKSKTRGCYSNHGKMKIERVHGLKYVMWM